MVMVDPRSENLMALLWGGWGGVEGVKGEKGLRVGRV
jgi:hypothetical protein